MFSIFFPSGGRIAAGRVLSTYTTYYYLLLQLLSIYLVDTYILVVNCRRVEDAMTHLLIQ